jgi:hypothetical protein
MSSQKVKTLDEGQVDKEEVIIFSGKGRGYIKEIIKRLVDKRT